MTTFADSINKQVRYKKQTAAGTAPGASGAQLLRRTESTLDTDKQTYGSNEVNDHRQDIDFRHGVVSSSGNVRGEFSPGTYKDFIAAILRRDFAATSAMASLSITIAAGSGSTYTVTRGSGSFLTDGVKIGDVIRLTAGSFAAANLNKNLLVVGLTATVATVLTLNGSTMTAEGPIASATVSVPGKRTYIPSSGHTNDLFAFEHWFSDIGQSELYLDCQPSKIDLSLPASGMATFDMALLGTSRTNNTSAYYSSPTALTSTGITAAINGLILVNGTAVAVVTGSSLSIDSGNQHRDPVVGSNAVPGIAPGNRIAVTGQLSAYFIDGTLRDIFDNESEVSVIQTLSTSTAAAADFVGITMPRVKFTSDSKSEGDKGAIITLNYKGLYNSTGGAGLSSEKTTLTVQDSQA